MLPTLPARGGATRRVSIPARNPYAGARSRQFNFRMLDPLKDRYDSIVRELADQGVKNPSVTELLHALMDEGPQNADDARALLQRWRTLNAGL